jgi:amidohydrolase
MSLNRLAWTGFLLAVFVASFAQAADFKARAAAEIEASEALLQDYVRYLNANPEIGFDLPKAADRITEILQDAGFEIERGVHGTLSGSNQSFFMEHAFVAKMVGKEPGPKVGLMVEYDALPVIGHGCQHDLSGAWSIGAGLALAKLMPELKGTLYLFGTPAEEGIVDHAGGKVVMLDRIRDMDAALMIHSSEMTTDGAENMMNLNREAMEVVFLGKEASPNSAYNGINALDANVLFWNAVNAYRPHLKDGAAIYGIITDGGQVVNTIPGRSASRFLIRVNDYDYFLELVQRVTEIAQGVAMAMGATVEVNVTANRYVSMVPNQTLAQVYRRNAEALGLEPLSPRITGSGGSSDMGNVSRVVPSIHPFLKSRLSGGGHTREAAEASLTEFGLGTIPVGANVLAMTAIDIFTGAADVAAMREELQASIAEPTMP